jgi:hypothetical protein
MKQASSTRTKFAYQDIFVNPLLLNDHDRTDQSTLGGQHRCRHSPLDSSTTAESRRISNPTVLITHPWIVAGQGILFNCSYYESTAWKQQQ